MKLRLKITKEAEIRFISHLEYLRTLGRAIRRSKIPAAYSEGFNPHLKFSLASALGVGVVSYAEFAEIELAEPAEAALCAKALAKAMPRGIRVLAADIVDSKRAALMSQAAGASYRVTVPCPGDPEAVAARFNEEKTLLFKKAAPKTKAKFKEIDVKFYIPRLKAKSLGAQAVFTFDCRITPEGSMKAVDLLNALNEHYGLGVRVELADIERLKLYRVDKRGRKLSLLEKDAFIMPQEAVSGLQA